MRHLRYRFAALPILVGFALEAGALQAAQAAEAHSFVIAANDGYGVQDCLGETGECGRMVANAWCEAQGHGVALSYGRAKLASDAYVVTCGD